jgi:hypothetical protein
MLRIAHFIKVFFQDMEVWLWKPDAKDDGMVRSWCTVLDPTVGRNDSLLDLMGAWLGRGRESTEWTDKKSE